MFPHDAAIRGDDEQGIVAFPRLRISFGIDKNTVTPKWAARWHIKAIRDLAGAQSTLCPAHR